MELPDRCHVCGSLLERKSFYAYRCAACGTEYIAQLSGVGVCTIAYTRTYPCPVSSEHLTQLEVRLEALQAELDGLKYRPFSWRRREKLKISLGLLDRQVRGRKRGQMT